MLNHFQDLYDHILNLLFFRKYRAKICGEKFLELLEAEAVEGFLELLLNLLALVFYVDRDFRRNIKSFDARYMFKDKGGDIIVSAIFNNEKLKVRKRAIDNTNITVIFKDEKALMNFLLSPKPDLLNAILNQEVTFEGNLNYICKFAYMATHLRVMLTGA